MAFLVAILACLLRLVTRLAILHLALCAQTLDVGVEQLLLGIWQIAACVIRFLEELRILVFFEVVVNM